MASAVLLLAFGCLCSAAVEDEAVTTKYQDICAQEGGGMSTVILVRRCTAVFTSKYNSKIRDALKDLELQADLDHETTSGA